MWSKKIIMIFILLPVLIFDWSALSHSKVTSENNIRITLDGFEKPGEWVIKFSRFRSKNWNNDVEKGFEDSQSWLKWLSSDNYKREEVLPDGVLKNVTLKEKEKTILAVKGRWGFPGFNWIVLEPSNIRPAEDSLGNWLSLVADEKTYKPKREEWTKGVNPNFIWLSGRVKRLFLYVWGGNFNYNLEAHVQDYKGNEYVLPGGNINYKGWRKIQFIIPHTIRQRQHRVPNTQPLRFLRFKFSANPNEDSSEFYTYLDYFHAFTDIFEPSYFGEELQFVDNYWSVGGNTKTTAPAKQ